MPRQDDTPWHPEGWAREAVEEGEPGAPPKEVACGSETGATGGGWAERLRAWVAAGGEG